MSGIMEQGHFERLDPPIVVGGVAYGGLLRFESSAEAPRWPGKEVLRFRVQEAEDLGAGRFAILAERRAVTSYATRVLGVGNSFEEAWQSACGGNVGVAPEPLRIYSRGSDDCQRGDMREVRLEEGDVIDAGGAWGFVESVEPYAALPSGGVDWRVTQGPRVVEWSWSAVLRLPAPSEDERASGNPLAAPDAERTADGNGIWRGSGVFLERRSSPGTWDRLSRQVYLEGDAIPPGMTLPRGTYHLTEGGDVTPASLNEADGDRYWALAWTGPWNRWMADLWPAVVEGAGHSGPAHTGPRAEWRERELTTSDVLVFDDGAGSLGVFRLFVRAGARGGDGWLELAIDGDRAVSAQACTAGGGTPAAVSVDDDPLVPGNGFVTFQFARSGSTYSISATDAGGTRVLVSADLGSRAGLPVVDTSLGVAPASGTLARFVAPTAAIVTAAGVSAWRLTQGTPLEVAHSAGFNPGLGPPRSVVSASGQAYAQATGDGARAPRRYAVEDGSRLVFYSDAGLVSVVASWPPPVETIAAPGRPPRPGSGVVNAADEEDPGNPTKNRLNYCDRVIARFPAPFPALPPGRELIGRRGATLDPRESWVLQFAVKPEGGDPDPAYSATPSEAFLARPAEGCFLLSQEWLEEATGPLCFRLVGRFMRCHANLTARTLAEPLAAARYLDNLWQRASLGGGGDVGLGGYILPGALRVAPTGFRVSESLPKRAIATGLAVGGEIGSWMTGDFGDVLEFGGLSTPIYASDFWLASTGGGWHGPTEAAEPVLLDGSTVLATRGQLHTGNIPAKLWTGGDIPGDPGLPALLGYGTQPPSGWDFGTSTTFKVSGIRIELPPQLRRCPPGTLVSAVAEVRLSDVESWDWEWERSDTYFPEGTGPSTGSGTYHINGVLYRSFDDEGSYMRPEGVPPPSVSAPLGFDLIGRRRRTGSVRRDYMNAAFLWSNPPDPDDEAARLSFIGGSDYAAIDADEWLHFGSAGVLLSDIPGGKWRLVDLSGAYSAMLRARDSACTDFYLVPRGPGPDLGDGVGELARYLTSLMPDARVEVEKTGSGASEQWTVETSARGAYVQFTSMEIRNLLIKTGLPSDVEAANTVPIIRRAQPLPG